MTCLALVMTASVLGACDREKEAATERIEPAPVEKAAEQPVVEAPAGETSEQITKRLLEAEFMQPRDVQSVSGMPPISLEPDLVELGDMRPNTAATGSLVMKNVGEKPLRILALRSTCACTVPGIEDDVIDAGESITIELELDANSATGPTERYVMALIEGYTQPVQLIVQAHVNYGIRASVTYDPPGQTRVAEVRLQSTDEDVPFRVISAGGEPPVFLDGFDPETDEPRTRYTIRQDLSSYLPDLLPKWFIVETDHPTSAVIDVYVQNNELQPERQRHRFNLSEQRLVFGEMKAGERATMGMRVVGGDLPDASVFVESLEWSNIEQCDVEIVSAENDQGGIELVVGVTPKEGVRGVLFGTVTIHAMGDARPVDIIGRVVASE